MFSGARCSMFLSRVLSRRDASNRRFDGQEQQRDDCDISRNETDIQEWPVQQGEDEADYIDSSNLREIIKLKFICRMLWGVA